MRFILLAFIVAVVSVPAMAKTWVVDPRLSQIGFSGTADEKKFDGHFKKFQVNVNFDPANPEAGKITATIDIASATTGSPDRDAYLPQSDWFDTKSFPQAEFETTYIGPGSTATCYESTAKLTIKGVSKIVSLPFCLTPEGDHMRAKGKLDMVRTDYNIGTGQWFDEGMVAHSVTVNLDIVAK